MAGSDLERVKTFEQPYLTWERGMGIRIRNLPRAVPSVPDVGGKKVTNLFVVFENGSPKLKVEYEVG